MFEKVEPLLFKKEINDIRNQRSILVGRLKSLLDGQMKMLEAYVGDWGQEERHMRLASESSSRSGANDRSGPTETNDAGGDKDSIANDTNQCDNQMVVPPNHLRQNKGVLCPDGHNQTASGTESM